MTLDQLASDMALEFGEQYSDLDVTTQFQAWANEVIGSVYEAERWFFRNTKTQVVPVAGTAEYTLPSTVSQVRDVQVPALGTQIPYAPVERLIARGYVLTTAGTPIAWYVTGLDAAAASLTIAFYKVPDAAYVTSLGGNVNIDVYAVKKFAVLTAGDTIPLPAEFIRAVRDGIRAKVKYNDNDLQGAQLATQDFQQGLNDLARQFHGPEKGGSDLRVKMVRATRQQPSAPEGS